MSETFRVVSSQLDGVDIEVLPAYRRRGLATMRYQGRHDLVRRLKSARARGSGGLLAGSRAYKATMAAEAYVDVLRVTAKPPCSSGAIRPMTRPFRW